MSDFGGAGGRVVGKSGTVEKEEESQGFTPSKENVLIFLGTCEKAEFTS